MANYEWVFDSSPQVYGGVKMPLIADSQLAERVDLLERIVKIDTKNPGTKLEIRDYPTNPPHDIVRYESITEIVPVEGEVRCLTLLKNDQGSFDARIFQSHNNFRNVVIAEINGLNYGFLIEHRLR